MTHIELKNLTKEFYLQGERTIKDLIPSLIQGKSFAKKHVVLNDISFSLEKGGTLGVVGKNGAGKSTLMKLIAGVTYPTTGSIEVNGKVAPLIELGAGFHHELNGYENIYLNAAILGMHKKEIELIERDIIEFSGIEEFLHEPLKRFSTGMVMRLAFSVAVHIHAEILLIDEVLAVGDYEFQEKCLAKLEEIKKQKDVTIVYISHDEATVTAFCDRAILLHNGHLILDDTPSAVFKKYHNLDNS
ncbi:MAG: ABC transporter ATP-binding protein [Microgenomates group bacterium]